MQGSQPARLCAAVAPRRRRREGLIGAGILIALFGAMLFAPSAGAVTTCSLVGSTLTVDHTSGINDVTVRVNGAAIEAEENGTPLACGVPPTTANVDSLILESSGGIPDFFVEEPGAFAPGMTDEGDGSSEIEMTILESASILSNFALVDTDGAPESFALGAGGVNLNPDAEAADDVDISGTHLPSNFEVIGSPGADSFDARGGAATGASFGTRLSLAGEGGNDQLFGGTSSDELNGGPGEDILDGGAGNDDLEGGEGNDELDGGDGTDDLDYSDSTSSVRIDLAAAGPQDAGSLGMDTISNVEDVSGSGSNDVLRGNGADNDIEGNQGDDVIEGRGGDDTMDGGPGTDTLSYESASGGVAIDLALDGDPQDTGGAGEDRIFDVDFEYLVGSANDDSLRGTNGINRIEGLGGEDTIEALGGDDEVLARDEDEDDVDCGAGEDEATLDEPGTDEVDNCETELFAPVPTPMPADDTVVIAIGGKALRFNRRGVMSVPLRCPAGEQSGPCRGTVLIRTVRRIRTGRRGRAPLVLARGRYSIPAGQTRRVRLKIAERRVRLVRRFRVFRRVVTLAGVRDGAGNRSVVRKRQRLVPLRRRG